MWFINCGYNSCILSSVIRNTSKLCAYMHDLRHFYVIIIEADWENGMCLMFIIFLANDEW